MLTPSKQQSPRFAFHRSGSWSVFQSFSPPAPFVPPGPFRDCHAAQESGHSTSGVYLLKPDEAERPVQAWCEQDIDNGGWTVIQSRRDGSVNFFRNWENYKVTTAAATRLSLFPARCSFIHLFYLRRDSVQPPSFIRPGCSFQLICTR